jgi:hypothetical protein
MAIDDHPLTVFNRQLENDELSQPVGSGAVKGAAKAVGAISQIPALRPLGLIAKGLDLTGKCLSIGVPTVEENLKLFGKLTEDAILRHEQRLDAKPCTQEARCVLDSARACCIQPRSSPVGRAGMVAPAMQEQRPGWEDGRMKEGACRVADSLSEFAEAMRPSPSSPVWAVHLQRPLLVGSW